MPKLKVVGVVKTDKMAKTRRVEIPRRMKYPKYGKSVRTRTVCYGHDENNESSVGDTVEIEECRPISKMKRWKLVSILRKAEKIDISAAQ
ncbi:MAG: 30S ribosomal protein S17 [Thermoguttaceae bacterium]|nr:30S ribosomal protein S17 [Thermoguttaceae bacterium]